MNLEKRIIAFIKLGEELRNKADIILSDPIAKAMRANGWFSKENILLAIHSLGEMLEGEKMHKWLKGYSNLKSQISNPKTVGVIMAGNIPLVGFHDFLCVLMSGNIFVGKLSSDDEFLLPAVAKMLVEIEPTFKEKIRFTSQPINQSNNISAFIATGSNNSARYFEYYFGKYPHIIRKNRNSIAILDGNESENDLKNLSKDIFQYFGLGCRNISKIYIPNLSVIDKIFNASLDFQHYSSHNKYMNNYNYYRTIYMMNQEKFLENGFLVLKEDTKIASPVATLYYEEYKNEKELFKKLEDEKENIQCVVSNLKSPILNLQSIPFGKTQSPELWDYADGVDTMRFLLELNK